MGLIQTVLTFVSSPCRGVILGYILATFHNRAIIEPRKNRVFQKLQKNQKKMFSKNQFSLPFSVHRQNTIKVSRFFSAAKKDYVKELENGHLLFLHKCPKSKSQGVSQKIP
jgi:hypothetical protein